MTGDILALELGEAIQKHGQIQKSNGRSENTIQSHQYRLDRWKRWLREEDRAGRTDELDPRDITDFKLHRTDQGKSKTTIKSEINTIRVFLRHMEDEYGAVREGLHKAAQPPSLSDGEGQRSDHLPIERGEQVKDYLRKYEWGSRRHVIFELFWSTSMRLGSINSIDEEDVDFENRGIELRHRPDEGTTLKNGKRGERVVSITSKVAEIIQDYITHPDRPDVQDKYERNPLIVTDDGRMTKQSIRNHVYALTRPCKTEEGTCPHDRDTEECTAAQNKHKSYKCPDSKAPHALRSGSITRMIKREIPKSVISDRVDASEKVIEEHYSELSKEEKMKTRRDWFDEEYEDDTHR